MRTNYHTHTWRCGHASGTEREYIEHAIEGQFQILGFSDHTPYPFPDNYESGIRMRMDQLEEYADTIRSLSKEYQDDIEIHLGLEVEYYPAYFEELQKKAQECQIEYFLLAQHFLGNEINEFRCCTQTGDYKILKRYCKQVIEAIQTRYFTYIAHPDLINFVGDPDIYEEEIRKICQEAKKSRIPLEINFVGILEKRNYPNERFWKTAGEEGCDVIFGADAHKASAVWNPDVVIMAEEWVERWGLHLVENVELIRPW